MVILTAVVILTAPAVTPLVPHWPLVPSLPESQPLLGFPRLNVHSIRAISQTQSSVYNTSTSDCLYSRCERTDSDWAEHVTEQILIGPDKYQNIFTFFPDCIVGKRIENPSRSKTRAGEISRSARPWSSLGHKAPLILGYYST